MLNGKRILITGANSGIGYSISKLFLENDANLVLLYRENCNNLEKLFKLFPNKKSNIETYKLDLLNENQIEQTINKVIKNHIDVFVHCPTLPIVNKTFLQTSWKEYKDHIELQTKSFFIITQKILPSMKEKKEGKILNILTSYVVGKPPSGISSYIVGKYSLLGLSKVLAVELGSFNITVNSISPSMTETPLIEKLPSKLKEIHILQTPLKRLAQPQDVSSLALFLCSNNSDYISGENFIISGGNTMH